MYTYIHIGFGCDLLRAVLCMATFNGRCSLCVTVGCQLFIVVNMEGLGVKDLATDSVFYFFNAVCQAVV